MPPKIIAKPNPVLKEGGLDMSRMEVEEDPKSIQAKAVVDTSATRKIAAWLYGNGDVPKDNVTSVQYGTLTKLVQDIGHELGIVSEQQLSRYFFRNDIRLQNEYDEFKTLDTSNRLAAIASDFASDQCTPDYSEYGSISKGSLQFPVPAPDFSTQSAYNSRSTDRVCQADKKVLKAKLQRRISEHLRKRTEFRTFFDNVEFNKLHWKLLLDPEVTKKAFEGEDDSKPNKRIRFTDEKTAEEHQLRLFKKGLPRRSEYMYKYFEKSGAVPLKFIKMERLLAVLIFHSLLPTTDENDWERIMINLYIDEIIIGRTVKEWMIDFDKVIANNDADFFRCKKEELQEMRLKVGKYVSRFL